jgi:predicted metal-dependent hydrolase
MIHRKRTPLRIMGQHLIILNGQSIPYTIKQSNRAKYVRLEIKQGADLITVIPRSYNAAFLPALLESKKRWILNKLAKYKGQKAIPIEKESLLTDTIPYLGRRLKIVIRNSNGNEKDIIIERNKLVVNSRYKDGKFNALLERWYRLQAENFIGTKAHYLSNELGLVFNNLTIRGQKTLWGSCSRRGNLSFNWKLMMVPESVIDYVVIHELMHLVEMNHSKRFWKLVSDKCPDWKKHRKVLKAYNDILSS